MQVEIKNWWTGMVLFSGEMDSFKLAVEAAVKARADLSGADLSRADLSGARLTRARLAGADLSEARLVATNLWGARLARARLAGADLWGADLSWSDLSKADLSRAELSWADLSWSDLSKADLSRAELSWADLSCADLSGARLVAANLAGAKISEANLVEVDLSKANLTFIRDDLWAVLSAAPREVEGLRIALIEGRVNGSVYEGECACLIGTIAHVRGCSSRSLPLLTPNSHRPSEQFFLNIRAGDTPENSAVVRVAVEWIDLWLTNMRAAFAGSIS